jgi:hypothetical protein
MRGVAASGDLLHCNMDSKPYSDNITREQSRLARRAYVALRHSAARPNRAAGQETRGMERSFKYF